jgi:hypothetical protein
VIVVRQNYHGPGSLDHGEQRCGNAPAGPVAHARPYSPPAATVSTGFRSVGVAFAST